MATFLKKTQYSIQNIAFELNVGKRTVLKAAVNEGIINTLDSKNKVTKFTKAEFNKIALQIKNFHLYEIKKHDSLYEQSAKTISIKDL
jgi:hypothetical protein